MHVPKSFVIVMIVLAIYILVLSLSLWFVQPAEGAPANTTPTPRNTPTLAPTACAEWPGTCAPTPTPIIVKVGPTVTPTPQPTDFWVCQVEGASNCRYWHTINRCGDPTAEPYLREWIIDVYICETGNPLSPQCLCDHYIPCPAVTSEPTSTATPTATPAVPYLAPAQAFIPIAKAEPVWVICLSDDCPWPAQP